jgi:phenylalanyl-tRNA synthetase alpha chain
MDVNQHIQDLTAQVKAVSLVTNDELEAFRLQFLARKGAVQDLFGLLGKAEPEQRKELGKLINDLRDLATTAYESAKEALEAKTVSHRKATDDAGLAALPFPAGSLHPITLVMEEIKQAFFRMGFTVANGPELEDDFHNFTALNFPPEHPARDMQDTFFVHKSTGKGDDDLVLRTHTSPVQIRLMKQAKPPIRAIMPGKVYRNESITYKSYCQFHQVEALYVNKGVSLAELKETLITFVQLLFGDDVKYRIRPSFFPFTEPSLEMDIWWEKPGSDGRWMEILGAGMVDPNVLEAVGIDSEVFTGFALGLGVERMALRKYGIDDIRILYDNDLRFLEQFD